MAPPLGRLLALEVVLYAILAIGFAVTEIHRRHESLLLLPRVVGTFLAFHVGYGLGMVRGLVTGR